jgi:4-carboxymuconolactone decarboxylase
LRVIAAQAAQRTSEERATPTFSSGHHQHPNPAGADFPMQQDLFDTGLTQRKATLGAEYVEKNLAAADDFTRPFQEAMTAWCWGFGWGDEAIDTKTRSMMNLAMIGALGKMHEWEIHCRGAITNGVTMEEIRAIIHVVGIYCGVPQSLECFRVARKVLEEQDLL